MFEFKSLSAADVEQGLHNALKKLSEGENTPVRMDEDACAYLAESAGGDLRKALGCLDLRSRRPRWKRVPGTSRWI